MDKFDWQAVLWAAPEALGGWWTWGCAVAALIAAILMFLRTVLREEWNILTFFRSLYSFGLFVIFLAALNSGWQRWIEPIFAISGLGMAVIYFCNWHHNPRAIRYRIQNAMRRQFIRPFVVRRSTHQ